MGILNLLKRLLRRTKGITMTLKVKISHASPGYPKTAIIRQVNPVTGEAIGDTVTVSDGQEVELFVHSGAQLVIDEGEPGIIPNGGGGPGEEK